MRELGRERGYRVHAGALLRDPLGDYREPMTATGTGHTVIDVRPEAVGEEAYAPAQARHRLCLARLLDLDRLALASSSKESVKSGWRIRPTASARHRGFVIAGVLRGGSLAAHRPILVVVGALLFACGIALAVWARLHLGRNWGMPMTQSAQLELVTSGPYRFVRHPIYPSGLLIAMLVDRARQQPARPDRRRGAGRVLHRPRDRRGAEPRGHLPQGVPGEQNRTSYLVSPVEQRMGWRTHPRRTRQRTCLAVVKLVESNVLTMLSTCAWTG